MKNTKQFAFIVMLISMLIMSACATDKTLSNSSTSSPALSSSVAVSSSVEDVESDTLKETGRIYLYGERHGEESILNKEFELWYDYYHNSGMRHLFVELPYYTAEFTNIWMQSDSDAILDALFNDSAGTASNTTAGKEFYKKIKRECPDTIFHGTDVGHQHDTTGKRFLEYLEANGMKDSEQYSLTLDAIEQGVYFYNDDDFAYRENKMAENFIREFEKIDCESIMGIYGGAHVGLEAMEFNTQSVPSMANQLKDRYGDIIYSEDLFWVTKDIAPIRTDNITVDGKEFVASYFGQQDLSSLFPDYVYREFWRLENAYEDFKYKPVTGDVLPFDNYPMLIKSGEVFVIDYKKTDDTITRMYYRSDGHEWNGMPSTEEFTVNE